MNMTGSSCHARPCCASRRGPRVGRKLHHDGKVMTLGTQHSAPSTQHSASGTDQYGELAELAGGFIHEIKNHLSSLGLNLQLLAEDFTDPQNQRERRALDRVKRLLTECDRLVNVSNDFLRFARVKDLDLKPSSLTT